MKQYKYVQSLYGAVVRDMYQFYKNLVSDRPLDKESLEQLLYLIYKNNVRLSTDFRKILSRECLKLRPNERIVLPPEVFKSIKESHDYCRSIGYCPKCRYPAEKDTSLCSKCKKYNATLKRTEDSEKYSLYTFRDANKRIVFRGEHEIVAVGSGKKELLKLFNIQKFTLIKRGLSKFEIVQENGEIEELAIASNAKNAEELGFKLIAANHKMQCVNKQMLKRSWIDEKIASQYIKHVKSFYEQFPPKKFASESWYQEIQDQIATIKDKYEIDGK